MLFGIEPKLTSSKRCIYVFTGLKTKKCNFGNQNLSPLCFLQLLKEDFHSVFRFYDVPKMHFWVFGPAITTGHFFKT